MALGGGTFITQNKVLPGTYINFVSVNSANANLSDRGIAAMALDLDFGIGDEIFEVTAADFQKNSLSIFGYDYTNEKLKGLRDLFANITKLYAYRLNSNGEKAANEYAQCRYGGSRGNALTVAVSGSSGGKTVKLYLDGVEVDSQTVADASELTDNPYVIWDKDAVIDTTAGIPLTGGTDVASTPADYQKFLDKLESYSYNAVGIVTDNEQIKMLAAQYCKRMRDEAGVKMQMVLYNYPADFEGVVNVKNNVKDGDSASLVYWVTGIIAGCAVNRSNLNLMYNGEFDVNTDYTQSQLETAIKDGEFTLHGVGKDVRVLADINSLVTTSADKGDLFKDNQTIRVIDQIANDVAVLFNTKYLGVIPNDKSGRISLWADIVKHHEQLQDIRAIEDFKDSDVIVEQGDTKKSVVIKDAITVVNAMAQLYMTCVIG